MDSKERTAALSSLARQIAAALNANHTAARPWTFVEPSEDSYAVYLRNAGNGRIYLQFDGYSTPTRITVSGDLNIGPNRQYVEVYEDVKRGGYAYWERVSVPSISAAISRGPEAIAKDIAKRFLPEYLRILALAEDKLRKDAEYKAKIVTNLQRLAKAANTPVDTSLDFRGEIRKQFTLHVGNQYHTVKASSDGADLELSSLSFEQAEYILKYLTRK